MCIRDRFLPVYVDCNRILDMTEQGFCELVLLCLQEASPALGVLPELVHAYDMLVSPSSDFQVPLSFSRGLTAALESGPRKLVLLFDEFDDPYQQVDARVFPTSAIAVTMLGFTCMGDGLRDAFDASMNK